MTYSLYVEFYGKKLKIEVEAPSLTQAKQTVRDNVKFLKVVKVETPDPTVEMLKDLFHIR